MFRIPKEIREYILSDVQERSCGQRYEPGSQMDIAFWEDMAEQYDYEVDEFKNKLVKAEFNWYKIMGMKYQKELERTDADIT